MDLPEQFKDLGSVARQKGYSNDAGAACSQIYLLQHVLKVCVHWLAVPV